MPPRNREVVDIHLGVQVSQVFCSITITGDQVLQLKVRGRTCRSHIARLKRTRAHTDLGRTRRIDAQIISELQLVLVSTPCIVVGSLDRAPHTGSIVAQLDFHVTPIPLPHLRRKHGSGIVALCRYRPAHGLLVHRCGKGGMCAHKSCKQYKERHRFLVHHLTPSPRYISLLRERRDGTFTSGSYFTLFDVYKQCNSIHKFYVDVLSNCMMDRSVLYAREVSTRPRFCRQAL